VPRPANPSVLFCVAAGPRLGFGHLVRCGVLNRQIGGGHRLLLRGAPRARSTASGLGWYLLDAWPAGDDRPDLVVVDDPSREAARAAVVRARQLGVPVASIHDVGLGRVPSDLSIDGSLVQAGSRPADLQGPAFAVIDPTLRACRLARPPREPDRILIALGGGAAVVSLGPKLAARIVQLHPSATVEIAAGFSVRRRVELPPNCRWLVARWGLADALSRAQVAVVAGGMTLYEACVLGTPAVALPVVPAQKRTVRAFAAAGAVVASEAATGPRAVDRAARQAIALLADAGRAARLSRVAARLVDGRGAERVAQRLRVLAGSKGELHHAA